MFGVSKAIRMEIIIKTEFLMLKSYKQFIQNFNLILLWERIGRSRNVVLIINVIKRIKVV